MTEYGVNSHHYAQLKGVSDIFRIFGSKPAPTAGHGEQGLWVRDDL